jgi:hypothetical protein
VFQASAHLLTRTLRELSNERTYPEIPTSSAPIESFKKFLHDYTPVPKVTSAAPGTSDHGQDRAVDFVVIKNGKTIAGTNGAQEVIDRDWVATGYDKALKKATHKTGLDGPLRPPKPNEPWHYWLASPPADDEEQTADSS